MIAEPLTRTIDPATGEITPSDPGRALALRAAAVAGDISSARWKLAELGAEAKNAEIREWAEIIAHASRNSARRVMEWAATFEWAEEADVLGWRGELNFTFFELARKYATYLSVAEVVELLDTFRAESGATAEQFEKELKALVGDPEPPDPAKQWRKWSDSLFGQIDSLQPTVAKCIEQAARALVEAAERQANGEGV